MIQGKEAYPLETLAARLFMLSNESYPNGSPWSEQQFLEDLLNSHSRYLLLEEAQGLLGFVSFHQVFDEIEIMHVVVKPEVQGQGLGQKLMTALLEVARQEQQRVIFLEVRQSNQTAQLLYEKNGFVPIIRRKNYYRAPLEDAVMMLKEVRETEVK